jgi:16S rRNA (adenine1518-N6/adenine1519-N6)-dimethyltransferase
MTVREGMNAQGMSALESAAWARPAQWLALGLIPAVHVPGAWPWVTAALGLAAAVVVVWPRVGRRVLVLFALGAGLSGLWGLRSAPPPPPAWPFAVAGEAVGTGTVLAEAPVGRRGTAPFRFRIEHVERGDWSGRAAAVVTVAGYRGLSPATGSRWSWSGRVAGTTLWWQSGEQTGWAAPWWGTRAQARQGLTRSLETLGPAPSALAQALLIGAVDDLTSAEKDSFRKAGVSHVLALSGMHLSLLSLLLTAALHRRAPPVVVFVTVQVILALFCFLAGPIPSLLRAWVMAALAGWWGLTKTPVGLRELLAQSYVVSVLLWPELASTLSLQLSFLAMAGLFWWSQRWERALRPSLGRWPAAQLAASASALAATVPLTLALFGEVRWIGLVLTPPLVFLTTVFLFGAAAVVLIGAVVPGFDAGFLAGPFQLLYDATFACTGWGGQFPALPSVAAWAGLALGGLGGGGVFLYNKRHRRAPLPVSLNYDSPASLQAFLNDQGYNALKRWGQNFLINAGARRQILAALELKPGEPVWEVGPGLGALTHHLVEAGHPLTVFEIDPGYVGFLRQEFGEAPAGFTVIEGDVVKTWKTVPRASVKTVGNLPYNAASAIIADFIEGGFFPEVFVVTVQLEMAQRMTAVPGTKNHSSFSVLCQSVFRVEDVVTLKPGSFYPPPEVTSRVVRLRPHGLYPGLDHRRFSTFVRECYSSRRKTLRNNLPGAAAALTVSDEALSAAFAGAGIDLGLRAETLSVRQFVDVFQRLG